MHVLLEKEICLDLDLFPTGPFNCSMGEGLILDMFFGKKMENFFGRSSPLVGENPQKLFSIFSL